MPNTVQDSLLENIRSRDLAMEGQARPCAILWTDPRGEWLPVVSAMQPQVEELLVLGELDLDRRTGPAIWIRCLVDGILKDPALPADRAPIVYLPKVSRQDLRAGEDCRPDLQPIVELMFRGTLWLQHNGNDWGVTTFLTSNKALNLDIARDNATTEALHRALTEVALTPVAQLQGRHLEADEFDKMLSTDVIRDLLRWIGNPEGAKARSGPNGWGAFCNQCREQFDFDPEAEDVTTAGERLGEGKGKWSDVWDRYLESPGAYGDLAGLLKRCRPAGSIPFDRDRWPDLNADDEVSVRQKLDTISELGHTDACSSILDLETQHGVRRSWVWASLGLSPMAKVLEPLSRLAKAALKAIGGTNPDEAAAIYMDRGWVADAAAWEALSTVPTADEGLIRVVVAHLLRPWLEDTATAFQNAVRSTPLPAAGDQPLVQAGEDCCLLFADGLRYDLGHRLAERLEGLGCRVTLNHRWAATPTVTATAKPAVTPVADEIVGEDLGGSFYPTLKSSGKEAGAQNLREAMRDGGYQILGEGVMPFPVSHPARGWSETGEIDELGHKLNIRMARQIPDELNRLAERITELLDAGWKSVRVVTDHGWLLLPGGLPKVDLPKHLTASRWARCAVISSGADPDVMRSTWHWNPAESFATAPGIACFNKTEEYAHGGLSLQECLIPDVLVERSGGAAVAASIDSITWRGLRCLVEATVTGGDVTADLRLERPNGKSVVKGTKELDKDGSTSLVMAGDEHESDLLVVVLHNAGGDILAKKPTRVGEDS